MTDQALTTERSLSEFTAQLASAQPGNLCSGFRLVKKEPAADPDA